MEIIRTDDVTSRLADPAYFTGRVWQEGVIAAAAPARVGGSAAPRAPD